MEGKIKGGIEVVGRRGRRSRKLLEDLQEKGGIKVIVGRGRRRNEATA
jgi:hypothetical protein